MAVRYHNTTIGLDRTQIAAVATGVKGENFSRTVLAGGSAMVDGTVYFMLLGFKAGDIITNVHINVASAGSTLDLSKVGVYNTSGTLLGSSADLTTSWESSGIKTNALSTPYTITATGGYYLAIVASTNGGGMPTVSRQTATTGSAQTGVNGVYINAAQTGQSDLPSSATLAVAADIGYWIGWS